jgi:aminoglycoside/choline kinase family phosphotransferase
MSHGLRSIGLSAPEIYGADEEAGVLLIEDLGTGLLTHQGKPHAEGMEEAVRLLAFLHGVACSETIPYGEGEDYVLPPYDRVALQTEVAVFLEWYLKTQGIKITRESQKAFFAAWEPLLTEVVTGPRTWALRDYHSPNLLWLKDRQGRARIGLLDFQDAV